MFMECDADGDVTTLSVEEATACGFEAAVRPVFVEAHALADVSPKDGYVSPEEYAVRHSMQPEQVTDLVYGHNVSLTLIGFIQEPLTAIEDTFAGQDHDETGHACCDEFAGMTLEAIEVYLRGLPEIARNKLLSHFAASSTRHTSLWTHRFTLMSTLFTGFLLLVVVVAVIAVRRRHQKSNNREEGEPMLLSCE